MKKIKRFLTLFKESNTETGTWVIYLGLIVWTIFWWDTPGRDMGIALFIFLFLMNTIVVLLKMYED